MNRKPVPLNSWKINVFSLTVFLIFSFLSALNGQPSGQKQDSAVDGSPVMRNLLSKSRELTANALDSSIADKANNHAARHQRKTFFLLNTNWRMHGMY